MMQSILVTGGTGFLGRAVIEELLKSHPEAALRSLSLPGEYVPEHWAGRIDVVSGNITVADDVAEALTGVDTVIHLASLLGAGDYQAHLAVTAGGTDLVLRHALEQNTRTVVVSSIAVYGDHVRDRICDETVNHGPQYGPYCLAKQQQEAIAFHYARRRGANCCIARPANVYGVGSLPWVNVVAAALHAGAPIIVDEGAGNAGLVHVEDIATGLLTLAEADVRGEAFNVCAQLDITWRDYFADIAECLAVPLPKSVPYSALYDLARQDECPERRIVPDSYRSIPLATLALIGSDNRFPANKLRALGWKPKVEHADAMHAIRDSLSV